MNSRGDNTNAKDDLQSPTPTDATQSTVAGAVELHEDELEQAVGGRKAGEGQKDFLKVTLKEVFISS